MNEITEFEAQTTLNPGEPGWWRVWGANVNHIRVGDIVLMKDEAPVYVTDTFDAKAAPMRRGLVDQNGERFTIGALVPVIVVRRGTRNTLA